ncbi:hypothetical protein BD289DRAFT_435570 [Coniella lustricola]|uniref:Uncharacterized protein n=1 Tax=Coniella lustricola TaxID=2025994 RepID=A0A2T3A6F3_9PEZI|nr:hypothetical protein BD289DRAFT_435570 [Coniella lustricola]
MRGFRCSFHLVKYILYYNSFASIRTNEKTLFFKRRGDSYGCFSIKDTVLPTLRMFDILVNQIWLHELCYSSH